MLNPRFFLPWLAVLAAAVPAWAVQPAPCAPAGPACAPPAPACVPAVQYVQKVVMCPTYVTENRVVTCVERRPEIRTYTCTVNRIVRDVTPVQRQCTVMVPQVQRKTVTCMVSKPVWTDQVRTYTVMVPQCETRQGTRTVCRMVPVQETRTVCEDQGRWEERPAACAPALPPPCGPCVAAMAPQMQRVWVPNVVQKQIQVTCMKPQITQEPCTYQVMVCRPEQRQCTVRVCHYEQVPVQREVCQTVCVPQVRTWTENCVTCRVVPEQQQRQCTVMVPHQVQKTVQVRVCRMVPQTIQVPVCQPCCDAAPCSQPSCRHCCLRRRGC